MRLIFTSLFLLASSLLTAGTITLDAVDSGWYRNSGPPQATNRTNYATGLISGAEHRSFFVFDLSGISGTLTGATLRAYNPSLAKGDPNNGFVSPSSTETLTLWDVSTSVTNLVTRTNVGAFTDLGGGTQFGGRTVSATDNGTVVEFVLNSDGLDAIQLTLGQKFAIGASLTSIVGTDDQLMFGFTFDPLFPDVDSTRQLVLTFEDNTSGIPEPSTLALTAAALLFTLKARSRR